MEHNRVVYKKPYDSEIEYLESTGTQHIYTGIIPKSKYRAICTYQATYSSTTNVYALFGSRTSVNTSDKFCVFVPKNSQDISYYVLYADKRDPLSIVQNANDIHTVELGEDSYLDGRLIQSTRTSFKGRYKISLFVVNNGNAFGDRRFVGKIFSFKLYNELNVLIFDAIPVRIGQVGYMYDKVSGQLFKNKGTGNFKLGSDIANPVPNIRRVFRFDNKRFVMPCGLEEGVDYQRYDWLKGDGTAYINTYIVVNVPSLYINTSFTKITNVKNTPLFGARDIVGLHGSHIFYMSDESLRFDIMSDKNPCITTTEIQNINQLIIDCPNKVLNFNGTIFASRVNDLSIKNSTNTFKIFSMEVLNTKGSSTINAPYNGAFGDFILNDFAHSIHLAPCQLLRSIPTYLDANGKARQVGECGMIDLISGKFYGNVVNAGTFTVENNN